MFHYVTAEKGLPKLTYGSSSVGLSELLVSSVDRRENITSGPHQVMNRHLLFVEI